MRLPVRVRLKRALTKAPLRTMAVVLALMYLLCTFSVSLNERLSWMDAMSKTFPTFLGELGAIEGTFGTRVSILVGLLTSIAFLTVVTSVVVSYFVRLALRGGRVVDASAYKGHIVICGWNVRGENIVSQLFSGSARNRRPVVIVAPLEQNPCGDDRVDFISGDPTRESVLLRAGIMGADTAIILTEVSGRHGSEADAMALMITLAIESLNPDVHTCVQVVRAGNRQHLQNANADEIICLDSVGGNLTVAAALSHGLARIVTELLTFNRGSEFYRCKESLTDRLVGITYTEAAKRALDKKMVLIAVETEKDETVDESFPNDVVHTTRGSRAILVNPQGDYHLRAGDALFVIAESEPTEL